MGDTKDARLAKKREEILEAATLAFRNEGYDTTSMDRIAELAGASKRTVYNHFGSKEALFQAVIDRFFAAIHALTDIPWQPEVPLEEQLEAFARAKSRVAENPAWLGLIRVVFAVFVHDPELASGAIERASQGDDSLVRWLEQADATGALRVAEPKRAANIFWALAAGALFWPQVMQGPMKVTERKQLITEIVQTFLCRYRC